MPLPQIELLYDAGCPNVEIARANLRKALERLRWNATWTEYRIGDRGTPPHARGYGSPTIFVDGRELLGEPPASEHCCRIYRNADGVSGAPTLERILDALSPRS